MYFVLRKLCVSAPTLVESISCLRNNVLSRKTIPQFHETPTIWPGNTFIESNKPKNFGKNRYRDVLPYDSTRVVLISRNAKSSEGDYINANHCLTLLNTDKSLQRALDPETIDDSPIPRLETLCSTNEEHRTCLKYIASQGPKSNTAGDFWSMISQQKINFIVMLTQLQDNGREKCFHYWPTYVNETVSFPHSNGSNSDINIKMVNERYVSSSSDPDVCIYAVREFEVISNVDKREQSIRKVKQVQYYAWPDHGVPNDCDDFLDFAEFVHEQREVLEDRDTLTLGHRPICVHCR